MADQLQAGTQLSTAALATPMEKLDFSGGGLRLSAYLAICIAVATFGVIWGDSEASAVVGVFCALAAVMIVWGGKSGFAGSKLVRWYFLLCAIHAVAGYFGAAPVVDEINGGSGIQRSVREAFLVVAFGLLCAAVGYRMSGFFTKREMQVGSSHQSVDTASFSRFIILIRLLAVVGASIMIVLVLRLGYFPILASDPGRARYLTEDLYPEFMKYDWILNKSLDFLRCSVPLLIYAAIRFRRRLDIFLAAVGFIAAAIPLRRADIISCFLVVILMVTAFDRRALAKCAMAAGAAALLLYVATQLVFLSGPHPGENNDDNLFQKAVFTALPEVRDLGWMIDAMQGERLNGVTLFQAVNPIPTFISEAKQDNALGYVTMRKAGFDPGGISGGLRITFPGEWFLNFGMVGVPFGGMLLGLMIRWVAAFFDRVVAALDEVRVYLAIQIFVWVGMWFYLAGTEAWGALRNGTLVLLALTYLARVRLNSEPAPARMPALGAS